MTKKTRITEMHLIITEYEWGKLEIECDFTDGDMLSEEVHNALWSKIKEVEDDWNKKIQTMSNKPKKIRKNELITSNSTAQQKSVLEEIAMREAKELSRRKYKQLKREMK